MPCDAPLDNLEESWRLDWNVLQIFDLVQPQLLSRFDTSRTKVMLL